MRLDGKVALVTGAGRGLGRAIAQALATEGADVAVLARTATEVRQTANELRRYGRSSISITADVSKSEEVERAVDTTRRELGPIDILVNNAGIIGPIGPTDEVAVDGWVKNLHVNLVGTFLCSRAVLPVMKGIGRGKIVNVAGSGEGPLPNFTAYAASKSAVIRFTETLAEEVRRHKIDVNAVAPGGILTGMTREIISSGELAGEKEAARVSKVQLTGGVRLDVPARLVVFLASPDSDGITGKLISAVHDKWEDFEAFRTTMASPDIGTMRRIDADVQRRLRLSG